MNTHCLRNDRNPQKGGSFKAGFRAGEKALPVLWVKSILVLVAVMMGVCSRVYAVDTVTQTEAVGQAGWMGQGETQRILGTAQIVSDNASGVTISSVAVTETGAYTGDGNLTNVEVWVSSSGYIDASAVRLENTAKAFSSDLAVFTQNVVVSTTPLYFIARCDVGSSATEGTFDISLQLYSTATHTNNPIAFSNATDVVAPPSGTPSSLNATASGSLLQVNLSWGAATGVDTYSIFRATYSGVTTTDFFLGVTNTTSLADDSIPPNQQMYYTVVGTNRAGGTSAASAANATSVDVPALTTSNIYLRGGMPGGADGAPAFLGSLGNPFDVSVDVSGNVYVADYQQHKIRFIPKVTGTYFGQSMIGNNIYTIAGTGTSGSSGDGGLATSANLSLPYGVSVSTSGNVFIADNGNSRIRFVPKAGGTYFGQAMTANYIYTIAGNGTAGYLADNVAATSTRINSATGVNVDGAGNVYIADKNNHRIRFVPIATGTYFGQSMTANYIYTIAGNGTGSFGGDGGAATSGQIYNPIDVSVDAAGAVYIADYTNNRIRCVPQTSGTYFGQAMTANYIYTIAGTGTNNSNGDGGLASSANVSNPTAVTVDGQGHVYVGSEGTYRFRLIARKSGTFFGQSMTANYIYKVAGSGSAVYNGDGILATSANLYNPRGAGLDAAGNLYIADYVNRRVRMVPQTTGVYFGQPMTAAYMYTIAGKGSGYSGGDGLVATVSDTSGPSQLVADSGGNIYFADMTNARIRFIPKTSGTYFGQSMTANYMYKIAGNTTGSFSGDGGLATSAGLSNPQGVGLDTGGNVYLADSSNNRVRFIPKTGGTYFGVAMTANYIYTIAGGGGSLGDGGAATSAQLNGPLSVATDSEGNVYVTDSSNHRVRMIAKTTGTYFGQAMTANYIYTIAGNGTGGYVADGVLATSTRVNVPRGISLDASGNVYVSDYNGHRIRFIPKADGTYFGQAMTAAYIYTIAGTGTGSYSGDGGAATSATIRNPTGTNVDAGGNLFIADYTNNRIRFIPKKSGTYFGSARTANYIYTIGGNGSTTYNGENAVATGKTTYQPGGVFAGVDHMVYLTDFNNKIRMIAGEDFIAPSTSTVTAVSGSAAGKIDLSWASAGDDMVNLGNLTGNYRIQYATYTATWSTGSTPTNATTLTISTTNVVPGVVQSTTVAGLTGGTTYYFALFTSDEVPNWSDVSNTASAMPPSTVTLAEAVGQAGWMGQGETQRILGTAQVVSDSSSGVTISSVAVQASGYTADGNLTNVEVWVSSSGYIDANAIRLENTAKAFSSNVAVFTQDVVVSTTPLYFIARSDVSGSATEGTFELALQVYTTAITVNNPIAFSNATDVVAPPSGSPSGLTATAASNLLQVNLSWGSATGADSYTIYRATHSGVTTTDFLLGMTNATSFADDYIPPNQQMYYNVMGTNRAGPSSLSGVASDSSVDLPALTTGNIYLRAGIPGNFGDGNMAYLETLNAPRVGVVDNAGNICVTDTDNHLVRFIPKTTGTYFGQSMTANYIYTIAGNGNGGYLSDDVAATSTRLFFPRGIGVDPGGNLYIADSDNNRLRFIPKTTGTYFGQSMTANYIYTIAGNGTAGYLADNVAATSTRINSPTGVSVDAGGNVTIGDSNNHRVRFIPKTTGTYFGQSMTANYIYTIAGDGNGGYVADNVASTSTRLAFPRGVGVDAGGNLYVADSSNNRLRFVPKTAGTYFGQSMTANYIYTIAGNGTAGYLADNVAATSTRINNLLGVSLDAGGNVHIADYGNHRVRFIPKITGTYFGQSMTANYIYTIAGDGNGGGNLIDGVAATGTLVNSPYGVSVDGGGNVYITDSDNSRLRFVPKTTGAYFGQSMTANYIYTIAGNTAAGSSSDSLVATSAKVFKPSGVMADVDGNLYIADTNNRRVRFVPKATGTYFGQSMTANYIYTIAGNGNGGYGGDDVGATSTTVESPSGVSVDTGGNVYIADYGNHRIRFVPRTTGTHFGQSMTANNIYTIAGDGNGGYGADNVAATSTGLTFPGGVGVDAGGNVYIGDSSNDRLRFVPKATGTYFGQSMTANYIYTIAGNGSNGYVADNVAATSTPLSFPTGMSVDIAGNVYVADYLNHRIRFIPTTTGTYFGQSMTANYIYTIAGNGNGGYGADDVAATSTQISGPQGVNVDVGGNITIADSWNSRLRFVPKTTGTYFGQSMTANYIYTIGGTGNLPYSGENMVATGRNIYSPKGVYSANDHMVYFTDDNSKIRMIAGEDFIAPSTSTLVAVEGAVDGGVELSWASAGDDWMYGNLAGDYRIQYATTAATAWSTSSTPSGATTLTISTTNVTPGVVQSTTVVVGLIQTWYFVIWTKDEANNWSVISATSSVMPFLTNRSVSITSGSSQAFGTFMMGSSVVGTTGTVVTNDGNVANTYAIKASTLTVGTPWEIKDNPPAGPNQLVIYGVFDGISAPVMGDFGAEDVIGNSNRDSTSTQFSVAGSTTGVAVPAGQDRTLWIRLDAPTTTTTVAPQSMKVEITAQPP